MIQENADPDVLLDTESFFTRLVHDGDRLFVHRAEGPDDMPAHIRTVLTQVSISVPITAGLMSAWYGQASICLASPSTASASRDYHGTRFVSRLGDSHSGCAGSSFSLRGSSARFAGA